MAQRPKIISVFLLLGMLCAFPENRAFAGSEFIAAYGRAEAAYTGWLADNIRSGRRPNAQERRAKHKELFQEAQNAYVKEMKEMHEKMLAVGRSFMRGVKNRSSEPGQANLTEEQKKALEANPLAAIETPNDDLKKPLGKPESTRAPASPEKPAAERGSLSAGEVKAGAAEVVSFKGADKPAATGPKSAAETGTAEAVSFSAPAGSQQAAAGGPASRGTASEGIGSAEQVSFSKAGGLAPTNYNQAPAPSATPAPAGAAPAVKPNVGSK